MVNPDKTTATPVEEGRPTVADLHGDNPFAQAAKKYWLGGKPAKFKPEILKTEFYDILEGDGFRFRSLLILENLQFLEKFLWPNFSPTASNYHVILVALVVNVKRRENLSVWDYISSLPEHFPFLFRRILFMVIDYDVPLSIRNHLLTFIVTAFQSLDSGLVRKECAPLVSISIWHNLSSEEVRNARLEKYPQTRKAWRAAGKRMDSADDSTQDKLRFDKLWLFELILDFLNLMYKPLQHQDESERTQVLNYCERFIEFLTDLESQLPTRRYVNFLLKDLHVLTAIKLSPLYTNVENGLFRDLYSLLAHYINFSIDDHTGLQLSQEESRQLHNADLAKLQRTAFKHFRDKLTILALANYGNISQRDELASHIADLEDDEVARLCQLLGLRTEYPKKVVMSVDRVFLTEAILVTHERRKTFQEQAKELPVLPNQDTLFEASLLRNEYYDGSRPLAIPKLNLQYLTVGDFLWRSFILYRCEAFFAIRRNIEDALHRLQPKLFHPSMTTQFQGFSKMAILITKPSILEVAPPKVGEERPAYVRAEISLDFTRVSDEVRRDWESLRSDDVVFLLAVRGIDEGDKMINGGSEKLNTAEKFGIKCLRAAEVVQILDQDGRSLRTADGRVGRPDGRRRLHVRLDPEMYRADADDVKNGKTDVYESINILIRRKGRENNFKPVLESIQELTQADVPMPTWLQEVFLGYGDPAGAHYTKLPDQLESLDYRDTFLDWSHLLGSFPGMSLLPKEGVKEGSDPPYVISQKPAAEQPEPTRKRRRDREETSAKDRPFEISTYKLPNMGPYPVDVPRRNLIKFTPTQVDAIRSGTNPGLTVIVGPPGTGKTDVATQVISNLYHNFPNQRTLLIAHSNQALNQLFEKITALDIDERHLLRLGHGEEDLKTDTNYSKQGRVESFMDNRLRLLSEVDRLAATLGAPGAHGGSCETADYFNLVYVQPAWGKFQKVLSEENLTVQRIFDSFPFHQYFSNAPKPMFSEDMTLEEVIDVAEGGYRHISKLFAELEDIRPFELLKTARDRQNYLLTKEARIVAMTSTHAAMKRADIAKLGFEYENVVMEEAAQITEVETFIPLALQSPKNGELPLRRVVLCGDHHQNSPVVQNIAFRQYANLEQSLFARLIRLGVPAVNLDQQGRARASIARLYNWRYRELGNLPLLETQPGYRTANAGFRHEFQFVNVKDYKGQGEHEPTPHFLQNLGEAEYVVAIFQYMRLLGYPPEKITILTTYVGQRALIWDVLNRRCARNPLFGMPAALTTVDKYQGEQNDYVIVSLVRTKRVGYLRDIRRMTVALSRARLGLYILGRREVFESCYELSEAFNRLLEGKSDKLELVTGEMWPTQRTDSTIEGVEMESVEHIGQYVYEMATTKVESMASARSTTKTMG